MALLVGIPESCVSEGATGNILDHFFVNWGTTGSCLIFTFHLSFWCLASFCGWDWEKTFWRWGWKQVCFQNYILDNTLNKDTADGDNGLNDNNADDNNNHGSDDNNDDKQWW